MPATRTRYGPIAVIPMGQHTFFGDVIDREVWDRIQEQLAAALRMEVHTLGPDGEDLCEPSCLTSFRRYLNGSSALRQAVPSSRREFIRRIGERCELLVDTSMTHRLHFGVPILFDGQHIATVYGGGTVPEPLSDQQIRELAERFDLDEDELRRVAAELPVAGREVVTAAAQVIESLLSRIIAAVVQQQRAEQQAQRLAVLARVGHTVTASLDLLRVLDAVVDAVPRVMDVKAAAVALAERPDGTLKVRVGSGVSDEFLQVRFEPGEGLFGYVLETGEAVSVPDMLADPRNAHAEIDQREGLRALLAVPLRDGDDLLGVIGAFHGQPHHFTAEDEWLLSMFADSAATAVRNARLYQETRQAYRELNTANRLLSDAQDRLLYSDRLSQLGLVAGGAAHEMRNTIGGIIGAASTVRDRLGELGDDEVRELLAGIAEECWRLRDVIEAVRQHAKPAHYGMGRHNLSEILGDAVRLLRFDRQFQFIPFEVECPADIEITGDRDRLKQALINILRNAAEAALEVPDRRPEIKVTAWLEDETLKIRIDDNGIGIQPEDLERVWDAFYTTKGEGGTGLGLEMVRQIVARHGGEVQIDSTPGQGTSFTISLPTDGAEGGDEATT